MLQNYLIKNHKFIPKINPDFSINFPHHILSLVHSSTNLQNATVTISILNVYFFPYIHHYNNDV